MIEHFLNHNLIFMLKIFLDQNFNHRILRGLSRRIPNLDFVTTQILDKQEEVDPQLLNLAFDENRVIVTHDKKTFPKYAYDKIMKGENISGVLIVPKTMAIGEAIDELEIIILCSSENEYENRVEFLPIGLM